MKVAMRLTLCSLLVSVAFAQHRGAGGGASGFHGGQGRGFHANFGHRTFANWGFYGGYSYWPGYWDSGLWDSSSYDNGYSSYSPAYSAGPNVTVIYPPPPPAYPVVVNQTVHPVIHEYRQPEDYGLPTEKESEPVLYLIAFKDSLIHPATTFWVVGDTLHYLGVDHKEQRVPLSSVDEERSIQLNRERHVPFHL